jgi:hypothetical protein
MSEAKEVSVENLKSIGGGGCTVEEIITITGQLTDAYESLIEFTTYVIGRVNGDQPPTP